MSELNQVSAEQLEICEYTTTVADSTTSTLQKPLTPGQDYAYVLTDLLPEQIPYKGIMVFTSKVGSNNFLPESCLDCRPEVDWNYYTETTTKFVQQHGYDPCGCRTCKQPKLVTTTRKVELDCCNEENCRFEIVLYDCREKVQGCDNLWLFTGLKRGLSRTECSLETDVARATEHFAGEQVLINPWTHFHDCCRQAMIDDCSRVWPCFGADGLLHYDDQGTFSLYCEDVWPCFNSSHGVENWIENGQMFFGIKIADDALMHWSEDDPNAIDLRCNDVRPCFSSWGLLHYDVSTGSFGFDCDDVRSCFSACGGISYDRFTGEFQSNFATKGVGMEITQNDSCTVFFENTEPASKANWVTYESDIDGAAKLESTDWSDLGGDVGIVRCTIDGLAPIKYVRFVCSFDYTVWMKEALRLAPDKVWPEEYVEWYLERYRSLPDYAYPFNPGVTGQHIDNSECSAITRFRVVDANGNRLLHEWQQTQAEFASPFRAKAEDQSSYEAFFPLSKGYHEVKLQYKVDSYWPQSYKDFVDINIWECYCAVTYISNVGGVYINGVEKKWE